MKIKCFIPIEFEMGFARWIKPVLWIDGKNKGRLSNGQVIDIDKLQVKKKIRIRFFFFTT